MGGSTIDKAHERLNPGASPSRESAVGHLGMKLGNPFAIINSVDMFPGKHIVEAKSTPFDSIDQ
jgi:hypothetical protein